MSTYTHIQTQIRDRQTMHRVLASIPGATVEPNAVIPAKRGGYLITAFRVIIPNESINAVSFFSSLLQGGVREFWVFENSDGTMFIEISHDIGAEHQVANAVSNALYQEGQRQHQGAARQERLLEQQRQQALQRQREQERKRQLQEKRRQQEAEQRQRAEMQRRQAVSEQRKHIEQAKRAEASARQKAAEARREMERAEAAREAKMIAEQLELREQAPQPDAPSPSATVTTPAATNQQQSPEPPGEEVRQEALDILNRLKQQMSPPPDHAAAKQENAGDQGPPADPVLMQDLNDVIAQEYSRQLVMEKVEEVQTIYGINLKEINKMEDGSIEIRLQR
jgi:hypothetical protein